MRKYNYNFGVTGIRFEWDERKNLANQRKHRVAFEDAALVFDDPLRVSHLERVEDGEERWQTFGRVGATLLLMVAHTVREELANGLFTEVVRIISARRATGPERRDYEAENG